MYDHLLARFRGHKFNGEEHKFSQDERDQIHIEKNRIYRHKVVRVNYTTYDMRVDQDSINPRTHADIMILAPKEDLLKGKQPYYWYGRVLAIFHADVSYSGPGSRSRQPERVEFLFIQWFGRDVDTPADSQCWETRCLPMVGRMDPDDSGSYSFLDPELVIRGVHLIPAFARGRFNEDIQMRSDFRAARDDDEQDWMFFYVNM